MFTLLGHLDYIRTVQFHHEYPWIISASDDQTIRLWNWQSRQCASVLTGHNHYVMSAAFHPKEDLVVSASLDQTVRVWDIAGLRKKQVSPQDSIEEKMAQLNPVKSVGTDLFGSTDAVVKYILEGHDRGVNWASFHPSLPLIVSGADDRQVKLWRMNESKAWEVDTLRGHMNNVSSVMFHPKEELIISNSEDKSIRVWDMSKRTGVQTFRREHDRFWILAAHPDLSLLAAGHDSGMIVFKLERERPLYATHQNQLFYVKDRYLRLHDSSQRDVPLLSIRRSGGYGSGSMRSLAYNAAEKCVLVCSDMDGGTYELYHIPRDASAKAEAGESKRGLGTSAVFMARNRFAVLDKNHQILIKNLKNEVTKKCAPPHASTDYMFFGGTGQLLLRSEDRMTLYDLQQRKSVAEINTPIVKYVVWSNDMRYVAMLSKHAIIIANRKLEHLCTVHETIRIKSGAWDEDGIFVYTTLNHIKYCLLNGDNGIIRTLEAPIYLTYVAGNKIGCLDRECKTRVLQVDVTEFQFKLALNQRKYDTVTRMIKSNKLCGQAIIGYLQQKGFPEVALHFVKDEKTRLNLALECGNIEVALASAHALDDKDCWHRLGVEALRQGNHQVVEMAYQRTKNFERLSFLYLITGNIEKLRKMLKIAEMRGDVMSRFHNALYLGEVSERSKILSEVGQLPLAYINAAVHGLGPEAEELAAQVAAVRPDAPLPSVDANGTLLFPPTPIMRESNWPLLTVSKGYFEGGGMENTSLALGMGDAGAGSMDLGMDGEGEDIGGGWGEELDLDGVGASRAAPAADDYGIDTGMGEGEGWDVDGLDLPELGGLSGPSSSSNIQTTGGTEKYFAAPSQGTATPIRWTQASSLAAEHLAAGAMDTAMQLLNRQVGVVNFEPLKPYFLQIATGSQSFLGTLTGAPPLRVPHHRNWSDCSWTPRGTVGLPSIAITMPPLVDRLKVAYKSFTDGKFSEAQVHFKAIIQQLPLVVVDNKPEVNEIRELVQIAREYLMAMGMEMKRRTDFKDDPYRQAELAAYMTHCNLQPIHVLITLKSAMICTYKVKNYVTSSSFCRRLLELNPRPDFKDQALKVLKVCDENPKNEKPIDYDERNPFVVCGISLSPIYRGSPMLRCSYCSQPFLPEHAGKLCTVCCLGQVLTCPFVVLHSSGCYLFIRWALKQLDSRIAPHNLGEC
jgi:coatomer protein complex subunit alpha (xenin)